MEATKCLNLDWRQGKDKKKAHSWWAFVCSEGVHKREIWIVVCGGDLKMALRKQSKVVAVKNPPPYPRWVLVKGFKYIFTSISGENLELLLGLWQVFNV